MDPPPPQVLAGKEGDGGTGGGEGGGSGGGEERG